MRELIISGVLGFLMIATAGCGGGGGGGSGSGGSTPAEVATPTATSPAPTPTATADGTAVDNMQPIIADSGPTNDYVDGVFTTVTVCVPGSQSACQTISGVLVDTGSSGLRILASALALALPSESGANDAAIAECLPFLDAFTWGPVRIADVALAGERASAVPIQIIGEPAFVAAPQACTASGMPEANTLATLSANGILGIGAFKQDCGSSCTLSGAANPGLYYTCASTSCEQTALSLAQQVQNPVWLFPQDNNGVRIELPSVPAAGAPSAQGSLIFGIGTQNDNALGDATVLPLTTQGTFTTIYAGQSYRNSFVDSGSNGLFFLDTATTGLPTCTGNHDFYCPSSTAALSAMAHGTNGVAVTVPFDVANADSLLGNAENFVFDDIAGPSPDIFDWGLPFFLGRTVFMAVEDQPTPAGLGPYVAY